VNQDSVQQLGQFLREAVGKIKEPGKNGLDFKKPPGEWLGNLGILQLTKTGQWEEPWHHDGGASIVHMGLTLWGARELACKHGAGEEIVLALKAGSFYISAVTGCEHQVRHCSPYPSGTKFCRLGDVAGDLEVSVMLRAAMFAHNRARLISHAPSPQEVFAGVSQAVVQWLDTQKLRLPGLTDCQRCLQAAE
jgi:hypothetical protein